MSAPAAQQEPGVLEPRVAIGVQVATTAGDGLVVRDCVASARSRASSASRQPGAQFQRTLRGRERAGAVSARSHSTLLA